MSQMTSLQKALKHCAKVSVLVATTSVAVRKAQAPVGSGSSTSPVRTLHGCQRPKPSTLQSTLTSILQSLVGRL